MTSIIQSGPLILKLLPGGPKPLQGLDLLAQLAPIPHQSLHVRELDSLGRLRAEHLLQKDSQPVQFGPGDLAPQGGELLLALPIHGYRQKPLGKKVSVVLVCRAKVMGLALQVLLQDIALQGLKVRGNLLALPVYKKIQPRRCMAQDKRAQLQAFSGSLGMQAHPYAGQLLMPGYSQHSPAHPAAQLTGQAAVELACGHVEIDVLLMANQDGLHCIQDSGLAHCIVSGENCHPGMQADLRGREQFIAHQQQAGGYNILWHENLRYLLGRFPLHAPLLPSLCCSRCFVRLPPDPPGPGIPGPGCAWRAPGNGSRQAGAGYAACPYPH